MLLVAAMSVSVLAGCGSKADDNKDAKNDASQEETLSVWCWDPNFNVYAMKQAEAIYQKDHPDFKLDIQEKVYSDIETALITAAEADDYSTLPDIFLMQDYSFHKNVANYPGIFTELTDSGIDFKEFSAGKLADSTVDGKNYGVPFDNGATIMAIRKDMVEAAGLTVDDFKDTTWSDFMTKAKKVVEANNVPMLTSSGGSEIIIEMLQSAGAVSYTHLKGAKYTKSRCPVELVYYETFATKEEAMRREYAVKQLSRIKKIQLISGENKVAQTLLVEPKNEIV